MWSTQGIPILRGWEEEEPAKETEGTTSKVGRKLGKYGVPGSQLKNPRRRDELQNISDQWQKNRSGRQEGDIGGIIGKMYTSPT